MNAADILATAERNASVRRYAGWLLLLVAGAALLSSAYCAGKRAATTTDEIDQSKRHTDTLLVAGAAIRDTLTVVRRTVVRDSGNGLRADSALAVAVAASKRADSLATIVDASHVQVGATVTAVPPELIARVEELESALASALSDDSIAHIQLAARADETVKLYRSRSIDSATIGSQAHTIDLIGKQHAPRCGVTCGIVIGASAVGSVVWLAAHFIR